MNSRPYSLPVIFISGHADVPMAAEAIKHGAFGFLQKPFRDQELLDHVKRALEHDEGIRAQLAERHRIEERFRTLTPRETEVFGLMSRGMANKAMAGELNVSQRTVEIHRSRVMEKMAAGSLAHLVRMSGIAR
jgi:FixJ family two-component response regulator